jgi:predicted nucleic acid-binding protein
VTVVLVDSDVLSELSRGRASVVARARDYLRDNGRLTFSAVTVFERLRGYRAALRSGRPFEQHLRQFEGLVAVSIVLPVDTVVAGIASRIWANLPARRRTALGDVLICATAFANGLPLATRNRRDFEPMARAIGLDLALVDWTR